MRIFKPKKPNKLGKQATNTESNLKAFQPHGQGSKSVCSAWHYCCCYTVLVHTVVCGGALRIVTTTFLCHIHDFIDTVPARENWENK